MGDRQRKSVCGCIVGPDIAVFALVIVKQGENDIPGLKDNVLPKRATKIGSFFNLGKEDDVRKYIVRKEIKSAKKEDTKPYTAPKIQHLVTPLRLQCRCHLYSLARVAEKKAKVAAIKAAHETAA
ncbi:hypothetical protein H0H87_007175 [Tephrocybe sp. NHM501043]|nr:hypothetical protein H0H87_007175 [Tephrocybe sp. NHM501043]